MSKKFRLLFLIITILMAVSYSAVSEEVLDYRADIRSYCRKVSELNTEITNVGALKSRSNPISQLVLFKTSIVPVEIKDADFEIYSIVYGPDGFSVLVCDESEKAVEWLLSQKGVSCAETDSKVASAGLEDTTESVSFQSWAAQSMGFDGYSAFSNDYGNGSASVAVIDSGVYRHSLINPKVIAYGYDYVDNDEDPTNDLNGHGTRVAGIVADCTRGLPVYIYPIRVLDADAAGKTSNVVAAVLEATEAGVDVINLSLSTFAQSEMLENAIRNAVSSGTTVVVAAGNYSCDTSEVTPAKMTDAGVIVVGSAEKDGSRSNFSNFGASVDVYAYGRDIMCCSRSGGFVADSGTSMAAPHVSALSAMIYLTHTSVSPAGVEYRIKAAAKGNLRIPSADAMIPRDYGFLLNNIRMELNTEIMLPVIAQPGTSHEEIVYESEDSSVVSIADGVMTADSIGKTQLRVRCKGLEDSVFTVEVISSQGETAVLPQSLTTIGNKAFFGLKTDRVIMKTGTLSIGNQAFDGGAVNFIVIPDTVTEIGENDFSGAVILCQSDSFAHEYAKNYGFQYLLTQSE